MKRRVAFKKPGVLAIEPKAFGVEMSLEDPRELQPFTVENGVAVVTIVGPLSHHADGWFDSYDAIVKRVAAALESSCSSVLLQIDSPGGDVAGLFEATRALRAMTRAANKPMTAYADGIIASAAYALACAADRIVCPETSFVGSVGVVETMMDHVAADRAYGLNIAVITSGARKADGHPNVPLSEGALLEAQKRVDSLAEGFFALVSEMRDISVEDVRSLEAGVFHGKEAVSVGLADAVASKDEALTMVASVDEKAGSANAAAEGKMDDWKKALQKAADDGDEDAKKALAAIEDKDDDKAEDDKDKPKSEDKKDDDDEPKSEEKKDEPKSEEKKDEPKSEGDEPDEKAIAAKAQLVVEQGNTDRRISALERERDDDKREKLLVDATTKKKLTASQLKALRAEKLPTMVRMLALIPDAPADPTAAMRVKPTVGAGRGGAKASIAAETPLTEPEPGRRAITAGDIDERMGLSTKKPTPRWEGRDRVFPMAMDRDSEKAAAKALIDGRKGGV